MLTEQTLCVDPACRTASGATTLWPSASCWAAAPAWPVRWSAAASHKQCSRVWASLGAQVCAAVCDAPGCSGVCCSSDAPGTLTSTKLVLNTFSLAAPAARTEWGLTTSSCPIQAAPAALFVCATATAAESVISIYTAEMLPTSCRSSVMGICSQASRLGSVTAPFLLMAGAQLGSIGGYSQASGAQQHCRMLLPGLLLVYWVPLPWRPSSSLLAFGAAITPHAARLVCGAEWLHTLWAAVCVAPPGVHPVHDFWRAGNAWGPADPTDA